ncbi:DNA excision repair protein ERCC-6 isoform X2 [Parasteatoda tepidariorum]|uniref:DNA excision repair protein ERCC-6 isoform X2 n=1 Tax=Parasteatoda tepidariorum TaxID=114398 RepID=UPI001C718C14|nr:DNA excision repair protein ERCC-6 isoform X2 [Parasteatoda tepidariorum]XP_042905023.1 DNA excision repair protein ERCC-6 isoform X3 [Parasteatoda tepidariorum]
MESAQNVDDYSSMLLPITENEQMIDCDYDDSEGENSIKVPLIDQLKMCNDVITDTDECCETKLNNESAHIESENDSPSAMELSKNDYGQVVSIPSSSKSSIGIISTNNISNEDIFSTPSSSKSFLAYRDTISSVPESQQNKELQDLGVNVYDQSELESEIMNQVDKAFKSQEEKRRVCDVKKDLQSVQDDIKSVKQRLVHIEKALSLAPNVLTSAAKRELAAIKKEKENKLKHLKKLEAKHRALQACVTGDVDEVNSALQSNLEGEEMDEETLYHLQKVFSVKETTEEQLIRTGEMTPFGTMLPTGSAASSQRNEPSRPSIFLPENELTDFDKFLLTEAESHQIKKMSKLPPKSVTQSSSKSPRPSLSEPPGSFLSDDSSGLKTLTDLKAVSKRKKKPKVKLGSKHATGYVKKVCHSRSLVKNYKSDSELSDFAAEERDNEIVDDAANYSSDDVYIPGGKNEDDSDSSDDKKFNKKSKGKRKSASLKKETNSSESDSTPTPKKAKKFIDDGDNAAYIKRIKEFENSELIRKHKRIMEDDDMDSDEDITEFDEDYKIPNKIWNKLYKYQQTAVRWLWELHQQNCGGIIGDEMGLGKTIQMITFLVGLSFSKLRTHGDIFKGLGPVVLVCPATVMHQWVKECHKWWPPFRAVVLHESGSFSGKKDALIRHINKSHGILITSYAGVVQHKDTLIEYDWHYVILDEGHKIRNPDAQATLAVKQFRTPHRIILSGSPIQNNLKELWSLFDFIFPGKLGTLPVFMQQFSVPIVLGGYSNASQVQVQTAYKCATVLRDTIRPYLLRRMKSDVKMAINLPNKNEQVLFCKLSVEQEALYKGYINSKEVGSILDARLQVFVGLINLRKICNHPDLFDGGPKIFKDTDESLLGVEDHYGYYKRSGKMIVVEALLKLWHQQGHRVLLFTQSRQMMEILELFIKDRKYTYMKMDGSTSIGSRQPLIAKFNSDPSIFVFILTTRVGGLGVNLTGANRVILYDPDWNPSTDAQARERAWRIGQEREVTIYRLLTSGTIEEKIYHRQIFKQFVTNRVLKDPRQRRFFKSNDLMELFTYHEIGPQGTETSAIFAGTGSEVKVNKKKPRPPPEDSHAYSKETAVIPSKKMELSVTFSDKKREEMKNLAKKLSLGLLNKPNSADSEKKSKNAETKETIWNDVKVQDKHIKKSVKRENHVKRNDFHSHNPSNSKTKEKKTKRIIAKVDGEKIDFVVKKSFYKPPKDDDEKDMKQDDYVLSKLFRKSGVHTALKHDKIVESSDPDYMIVEGEASKVAKEAIKALRESRRLCARAEEGVPTWTGQHGEMRPRFGQKKKLPIASSQGETSTKSFSEKKHLFDGKNKKADTTPSSSDLLSAIKKRKVVFGTDAPSDDENESMSSLRRLPAGTEHDDLLVDIRNFVAFGASVDGQASTQEIVDTFKTRLPIHQTAVFKALLSKICDFIRSSGGEGIWHLKSEFR